MWRLASRKTSITITPVASALLRTESAEFYRQLALTLRVGDEIPLRRSCWRIWKASATKSATRWRWSANTRCAAASWISFPAEASKPIRIELFGDLIESIRRFDVETQRSVMKISETTLLPLVEYPKSRELFLEMAEQMDVAEPGRSVSGLGISGAAGAPAQALAVFADRESGGRLG